MKRVSQLLFIIAAVSSSLPAQQIRSATWSTDRFLVRYRTMLEPPRPKDRRINIGGGGADDSDTNHRILTDSANKTYFGYDLRVAPVNGGKFQVTFQPLSLASDKLHFFDIDPTSWRQILLPTYKTFLEVNDGETIALDLMINPSNGEKIVECVTVSSPAHSAATTAARDLQLDDVQMSLASPRLHINGKSVEWNGGDAHGSASGATVWFYVPDRGRFLLSCVRRESAGFRQAGEVRGSRIKFTWNNDVYELQTRERILPGDGAWNLYVSQETGYRPEGYPPALYGSRN